MIAGWVIILIGTALWIYGYLVAGLPSLFDWKGNTPPWIAEFLPNLESEMGAAVVLIGSIVLYWPRKRTA